MKTTKFTCDRCGTTGAAMGIPQSPQDWCTVAITNPWQPSGDQTVWKDLCTTCIRLLHEFLQQASSPEAPYESKEHNDDPYNRCNTEAAFLSWLTDCGWKDAEDFKRATGVTFEEIRGVWFNVTDNRLFILP